MNVQYTSGDPGPVEDTSNSKPKRPAMPAMMRGFLGKCPNCGKGKLFKGYLATQTACNSCGEDLHHHRADDAPPYFTITVVGHVIIPGLLAVELLYRPPVWAHLSLWIPLTLILSLGLLRPIKGALIGLQWALYMHGFDPDAQEDLPEPDPAGQLK
ncbi:DUF983 domain-containing protein [Roseibium sp. RKSG952]|uniref:DUF983 domain-containing protein n=1 Tax=Roseibium sp. RKSG952 TaxID=2529384 RepID=UPI0012BD7D77|nr:DUF983 domain-containing protein [Roseibium sp. RKSG952]MTH97704.1 DUF983 domain-containing protein [Roseibium sp. RKSG952]